MEAKDKGEAKYWRDKWEESQKELEYLRTLIKLKGKEKKK